jgi:hypothetical protein
MSDLKEWYFTFKGKSSAVRNWNRYYIIPATSLDKARKRMIDSFGNQWENVYTPEEWYDDSIAKKLPMREYIPLTEKEYRRQVERDGRIRYKVFVEKEGRNGKEVI